MTIRDIWKIGTSFQSLNIFINNLTHIPCHRHNHTF